MAGGNGQGRDDAFLSDVLRGIGAPVNAATLAFMRVWVRFESGTPSSNPDSASWNPLNSTLAQSGSTLFNVSPGVRNYRSREDGLKATIATFNSRQHYYDGLKQALQRGNGETAMRELVASKWNAPNHYGASKLSGGGYDYRSTDIYKSWKKLLGGTAAPLAAIIPNDPGSAAGGLPAGLVSGDGSLGTAKYDPISKALIDAKGIVWFPYSLWLAQASKATRKGTAIIVVPGAYKAAGGSLDPGAVSDYSFGQLYLDALLAPVTVPADAGAKAAETVAGNLGVVKWIGDNLSRIGVVLLGVLIIILAFIYQSRGSVMETAKVAAKIL